MRFFKFLAASLATSGVVAHPGHDIVKEVAAREAAISQMSRRSLGHCAEKLKRSGVHDAAVARRSAMLNDLRAKRALTSDSDPLYTDHNRSHTLFNLTTPVTTIFGTEHSCLLAPDTTEGPYFISGEYIRTNLTEDQVGVAMHLDLLVIDTNTCDPVTDAYVELYGANATGVYGGVVEGNNGNPSDESNAQNTWLRGVQLLNSTTGTAQFDTLFPGHYHGRAPHLHVMVHQHVNISNRTRPLANGTLQDHIATHTGQIFFDQDLITQVKGMDPYTSNHQRFTRNTKDAFVWQAMKGGNDPFVSFVYLNGRQNPQGGLLAWITVGVNMTAERKVSVAGTFHGNWTGSIEKRI